MPGLVWVAVSTELLGEAGRGRRRGRQQVLPLDEQLDAPSLDVLLSPSPKGLGSCDHPPSTPSPLAGQVLCLLDTFRVTQLTQKKALTISFWISSSSNLEHLSFFSCFLRCEENIAFNQQICWDLLYVRPSAKHWEGEWIKISKCFSERVSNLIDERDA